MRRLPLCLKGPTLTDATPEALRLAHALDGGKLIDDSTEWADTLHAAADELRRLHARVQDLERERDNYKLACDEWQDKTDWVQQTALPGELGKHRADVLRDRINRAVAAEREACAKACEAIEAERWKAYKTGTPEQWRGHPFVEGQSDGAEQCAAAIRARSDK